MSEVQTYFLVENDLGQRDPGIGLNFEFFIIKEGGDVVRSFHSDEIHKILIEQWEREKSLKKFKSYNMDFNNLSALDRAIIISNE